MCAKVKRQTFKGKPLPLNQFYHKVPDTLLAYIFSFLTPRDLHSVGLVCKWWRLLLTDESIWRDAFERFFINSPPIRLAESWKLEYLSRVESVRNLEFSRLYVTDIDSRLSQVDRMVVCQPNVITPDSLSVGHLESGACSLLEIKRGKFIKYVWFGSAQRQPTCLELASAFYIALRIPYIPQTIFKAGKTNGFSVGGLVGFLNGQVAFSLYSASTVNFLPMESSHTAPISALAFSTGSSEATPLLAASGSLDGLICIWDTARPRLLTKLKGLKKAVKSIILTAKSVLALDAANSLFLWQLGGGPDPPPKPCGAGITKVDFVLSGEAILVLYGSGALERFDLNTLERVCLSDSPLIKCYHLNPSYPKFVAIARADSALLTQIKTKSSRIYQVRRSIGASIVQPHAIFFDNVKLVTFFEDDTIQIWCAASGRPIRKIALSNYIPRRLASNGGRPSQLVAANSTRLLFATGKHVVVIGVGSESAHLASKPKNSGRRKVKAHADVKHAVRETLQDLEDEANAKASAYSKLQSLQGLSGLTEEEVLQYALALSREDAHPKSELGASDSEGLDGFSALNLTEEEALNYAVFLSRESQH